MSDTDGRDRLARAISPFTFTGHGAIPPSTSSIRRALIAADRAIAALPGLGYVTTAEADRRVAEARSEMGMAHAIISRAREAVRDGYERDQIALILNNRVRGWDSALSPTESEAPNEPSEL